MVLHIPSSDGSHTKKGADGVKNLKLQHFFTLLVALLVHPC